MSMSEQKIPLILICGFLGSGKTTLVNRLLREGFDGERVAIVVNDFGSVAIDEALIDHAGEGMLALTNGCICCTLASDLVQGLKAMLDTGRYERIVMETSGVTAVKSLLEALAWPGLANRLELERIITVVDAARYPKIHRVVRVVDEQVHHADVIVMNYIDYAKPEQREHTENSLREINPGAPVIRTSHSQVTREQLAIASRTEKAILAGKVSDDWFTCRVAFEQPVTRERLELALGALPAHLHRLKGFVREETGAMLHVERAGEYLCIEVWVGPVPENSLGILVAIGSSPIAPDLAALFGEIQGATVISDHALHAHHHDPHHKHHHEHAHHD